MSMTGTWIGTRLVEDSVLDSDSDGLGLGLSGLDYNTGHEPCWTRLVEDSVLDSDSDGLGLGLSGLDYNTGHVSFYSEQTIHVV